MVHLSWHQMLLDLSITTNVLCVSLESIAIECENEIVPIQFMIED